MNIDEQIIELNDLLANNNNYNDILEKIDNLIENYPDKEQLYELKSKTLYFSRKFNICQNFCEKALGIFPNNVNIMYDKAECLFQKGQYQASYEFVNNILLIDKNNKSAKDLKKILKPYVNKSFLEKINESKFLNSKYFFILLGIVIFSLFIYYSPSSESMLCNSNYECTYERTYFNFYKIVKNYNISNKSFMDVKVKHHFNGKKFESISYYSYPIIVTENIKIEPFVHYYISNDTENEALNSLNNEIRIFDEYIKNPNKYYIIKMNIYPMIFYILFPIFLFLYIAYYLKLFSEGNSKK